MDIQIKFARNFQIEADLGAIKIMSDQSKESGGDGTAPNPYQYFVASIGLCVAHYVNAFCKQRNLPTEDIGITESVLVDQSSGKTSFKTVIKLPASFPEKYREPLLKAAEGCKVKKAIQSAPDFKLELA